MNAIEYTQREIDAGRLTARHISQLALYYQRSNSLVADGKPGAATRALLDSTATENDDLRVPKNRAEVRRIYGDPSWVKLPRGRAVDLDDHWEAENIRWFRLHTGKRVRLHRLVGPEFVRLFKMACDATPEYMPQSVQTFVPRVIGGTNRLSMHAYGCAVDFDPARNPWGADLNAPLRKYPSFLKPFRDAGWTIGGDWRNGNGDWMHIQRAGV